jgi:hypothetical protein
VDQRLHDAPGFGVIRPLEHELDTQIGLRSLPVDPTVCFDSSLRLPWVPRLEVFAGQDAIVVPPVRLAVTKHLSLDAGFQLGSRLVCRFRVQKEISVKEQRL